MESHTSLVPRRMLRTARCELDLLGTLTVEGRSIALGAAERRVVVAALRRSGGLVAWAELAWASAAPRTRSGATTRRSARSSAD